MTAITALQTECLLRLAKKLRNTTAALFDMRARDDSINRSKRCSAAWPPLVGANFALKLFGGFL
jgi:hypothetical protein